MKIKWRLLGLRDHIYKNLRDGGDSYSECGDCGAVVVNKLKHAQWHHNLTSTAQSALRADMWTTPL